MRLRARLLLISLSSLIVPIVAIIAVASAMIAERSSQSQQQRYLKVLEEIQEEVSATEARYRASAAALAGSESLRVRLYVYAKYWGYIGEETRESDILVLRGEIEKHLLADNIDTIGVYRIEGPYYRQVAVVGSSAVLPELLVADALQIHGDRLLYSQTADGLFASLYQRVAQGGVPCGLLVFQRGFNRGFFQTVSLRTGAGIALYAQGLFRFSSLPGIESSGITRQPQLAQKVVFSGSYTHRGITYNYVGHHFELPVGVRGILIVGGAAQTTLSQWTTIYLRLSVLPLACILIATAVFYVWGSRLIGSIRTLVEATHAIGQGNYELRLPARGHEDEFGELFRGFNAMAEELGQHARRLEEYHQKLLQSEKMAALGQFAAGIAHEINNPLGVILNHVQLLRTGRLGEAEQRDFLARVETEIKRMHRLLDSLLHRTTPAVYQCVPVSLEEMVHEIVRLFAPKLRLRRIPVAIEPFPEPFVVQGDRDSLKQVFFNIIQNAIQAIDGGHGRITIRPQVTPEWYVVAIADNGRGMDEETRKRIFEQFYTSKVGYGTGLGLSLSRRIMRRHGGDVEVASELGEGTTVTLRFARNGGGIRELEA